MERGLTILTEKCTCSCIQLTSRIDFLVLILRKHFVSSTNIFFFLIKTKFHLSEQWKTFKRPYPCKEQIGEWWHSLTRAESPKYSLIQPLGHPNSTELTITRWVFDEMCQAASLASSGRAKHPFTSCLNYFCFQGFTATLCNLLRAAQAFFIIMKKTIFLF